jgi:hypothetical protein
MTDYILIALALVIIWFLRENRRETKIIKEDIDWLHNIISNVISDIEESREEHYYYVPYEKDGKKGKKKIKMYEDDEDVIYQEKKGGKVYHSKKQDKS